jgi:hypothetical protein
LVAHSFRWEQSVACYSGAGSVARRAYAREYPHFVALPDAGGWRTVHTGYALAHPEACKDWRWWTAGSDVAGSLVNVWGLRRPRARALV